MFGPVKGVDPTRANYNRAAAAKANADAQLSLNKNAALSNIGNMVQDMATGDLPEASRPDPKFEGPMPAMTRGNYIASRSGDLTSTGLRAGLNPEEIGQIAFQSARRANLPPNEVARFSPDLLPMNEGLNLADRDALIAQDNAAKRSQAVAVAQADPVKIGEGDTAMFGPNDPRGSGTIYGLPTLNTERGAVAQEARETGELTPLGRTILGDSPGTPRNYITGSGQRGRTVDGITDLTTGTPLPQDAQVFTGQVTGANAGGLTGKVASEVQSDTLATRRFRSLLGQVRTAAEKDPTNFGIPGFVKGVAQDFRAVGQGIATGMGYDGVNEAVADVQSRIVRSGLDPSLFSGVFDPGLPALQTLSDLLVYNAAAALAQQEGRSVSDGDVKRFQSIAGNPRDWLMSQEKYLAKLQMLENVVTGLESATNAFVSGQAGQGAPPAAAAVPPAAQRTVGEVYVTPRGPAVWRGDGWELQ